MRTYISNAAYKKDKSVTMCGTPEQLWVRGEVEMKDGKRVVKKYCPNCAGLKEKKCRKCGEVFKPGCRISFFCGRCYSINKRMGGFNV